MIKSFSFTLLVIFIFSFQEGKAELNSNLMTDIQSQKTEINNLVLVNEYLSLDGDIQLKKLDNNQLPKGIQVKGSRVIKSYEFEDKNGRNLLVLSEHISKRFNPESEIDFEDTLWNGAIYAQLFHFKSNKWTQYWMIQDFLEDCPEIVYELRFLDETPLVTDLDNDGLAEVWIVYRLSDAVPNLDYNQYIKQDMKIIMYEGQQKHAARGKSQQHIVVDGDEQYYKDGSYKLDDAFNRAPKSFKNQVSKLWKTVGTITIFPGAN